MLIPFHSEPTPEQRYKNSFNSSLKKAKHLSNRVKNFLSDVNSSNMKGKDKQLIKDELLKFLNS